MKKTPYQRPNRGKVRNALYESRFDGGGEKK